MKAVPAPTWRLIPTRFPPIDTFEAVASADDLAAVIELEGWTNDRLVANRLARLPRDEWVFGRPNASVVMAAFLHAPVTGARFNGPDLGAWYCAMSERTAIAEVAHHLRREAQFSGADEMRVHYRAYTATLAGDYHDIRGLQLTRQELYARDDWGASQVFGEGIRASGGHGIIYDSLRHAGGINVVAYRPTTIDPVTVASTFDIMAPVKGRIVARRLS